MNADSKLQRFLFTRWLHVSMQHEASARIESPSRAENRRARHHSWNPRNELSIGILAPGHAFVTRRWVRGIAPHGFERAIYAQASVVRCAWIRWPQLDRVDPFRRVDRDRDDKVPELVAAIGGKLVLRRFQNQVGLFELPAIDKLGGCRQVCIFTTPGTTFSPFSERFELFV